MQDCAKIDDPSFHGGFDMNDIRRIVSFLPSATEMACALGLSDQLLGITHECDYPPQVRDKPVVVRNVLPIESMSQAEIDVAVTQRLRNGQSLYRVEEALMQDIAPDLILTQDLCQVCAPSGNEVTQLLQSLPSKPEILWLTPKNIEQIFGNLRDLGAATILLKPAAPGTGVIAGGSMRAVLELAGIHDILTKCLGTNNPINVVMATISALKSLRTVEQVAAMRGKTVREIYTA